MYPAGVWFADVMSSFSGVTFVLFRFRLYAFIEASTLRLIVLRYTCRTGNLTRLIHTLAICDHTDMRPDSHTQLPNNCLRPFLFLFLGDVAFSEYFCTIAAFSLCTESTSYVFSFRMVFFYLVTTGWTFDVSSCENSINQSTLQHLINQSSYFAIYYY